ncbi:MAG: FHA domain-containing protein [Phocaeicola sp.]
MLNRFKTAEAFKSALCSEQSEEKQTSVILKTVVTVGRKGCDINISNEYVSGKHLSLEYHQDNITNQQNSCLILIDSSSNGTSVDGKYLHREKMSIPFTLSKSSVLPEVYLAGRTECKLDWNEVIRFFTEREQLNAPLPEIAIPDPVVESEEKDKESNVGVIIFSFLFPLVGWITWGIYKKRIPKRLQKLLTQRG